VEDLAKGGKRGSRLCKSRWRFTGALREREEEKKGTLWTNEEKSPTIKGKTGWQTLLGKTGGKGTSSKWLVRRKRKAVV